MLKRRRARAAFLFALLFGLGLSACPFVAQGAGLAGASDEVAVASAEPLDWMEQPTQPRLAAPFGRIASELVRGSLPNMWRSASRRLPLERHILMQCRVGVGECPVAAERFLAVINRAADEEGWTRIAEINRAINLDIRPVSDVTQYGVADLWPTPLMAFASNAGDCKDYAIAKYVALSELGVPAEDLRLVIVRIKGLNEVHAVVAVCFESHWLILDNRTSDIRHDADIADYDPLFVIAGDGVRGMALPPPEPQPAAIAAKASAKPMLFAGPESSAVVV